MRPIHALLTLLILVASLCASATFAHRFAADAGLFPPPDAWTPAEVAELERLQTAGDEAAVEAFRLKQFNDRIEQIISGVRGGPYEASWSGHGVENDIAYDGEVILAREKSTGSYCVSATLEAFANAYLHATRHTRADRWMGNKTADEFRRFKFAWFVQPGQFTDAAESERVLTEGCAFSIVDAGIGEAVPIEAARRGDFVQFWYTTPSGKQGGHSAILWKLEKDDAGRPTRAWYWSSHRTNLDPSTGEGDGTSGYGLSCRDFGDKATPGRIHTISVARVTTIR